MKSNVDLYLNSDKTKVVLEGDREAASLLVNAGREIPDGEVIAMGRGILEQAQKLAGGQVTEKVAEAEPPAPEHDDLTDATSEKYDGMKKVELVALASQRGISLEGNKTNAEIIALLQEDDAKGSAQ
jgi:hypothetical protein